MGLLLHSSLTNERHGDDRESAEHTVRDARLRGLGGYQKLKDIVNRYRTRAS
jgi:hypothetical protein